MGKYFIIQVKRLGRILPLLVCVMAVLFGGIYLVYQNLLSQWSDPSKYDKISVGMVGTAHDRMLNLGISALKTLDSSNMSVELLQMEEKEARKSLESGEISAYIVFPDEFMENALSGQITPLQFVSAAGGENIISMVKDELTSALADILLTSEQGTFALDDLLNEYGYSDIAYDKMNELALNYITRIMDRAEVYTVEELGIAQGLSFSEYMMSGLSVVFLFFLTLPFVTVFVKEDPAIERLLKSKRVGALAQVLCEYGAYLLCMFLLTLLPLQLIVEPSLLEIWKILPVVLCISAISFTVFSLTKDLISGVLLQMIVAISMCFVSGCMYPVYFFPVSVQNFSRCLPAAMARDQMTGLITGDAQWDATMPLTVIGLVLVAASVAIRWGRIHGGKGARL